MNKVLVHIDRVLKITTAQTVAVDSMEKKIMNLSKRDLDMSNDLINLNKLKKFKSLTSSSNDSEIEIKSNDGKSCLASAAKSKF